MHKIKKAKAKYRSTWLVIITKFNIFLLFSKQDCYKFLPKILKVYLAQTFLQCGSQPTEVKEIILLQSAVIRYE